MAAAQAPGTVLRSAWTAAARQAWMTALAPARTTALAQARGAAHRGTGTRRGRERRPRGGTPHSARQRTAVAVPRKTPRWRRNRKAWRSAPTLRMPRSARTQRAHGRRCHCRGAHLVRMARRRHPPTCGVTTCRRPCSAASWTRKNTPSHSPGSLQPNAALAARRPRAAASLRNPFSRPFRPPRRHRERRQNLRHWEPRRQRRCHRERCRRTRSHPGPRHRPRRWRPRRHPRCQRAARRWRPHQCSRRRQRRPDLLRPRQTWRHRPARPRHRPRRRVRPLRPPCRRRLPLRPCPHRPCPHRRARPHRRVRLRRPATAGPPVRAGHARAAAVVPAPRPRRPPPCRPPSGHGGPGGPTASPA
jgi:hypothetical protein